MIIGQPEIAYEELAQKYELDIQFSSEQEELFRSKKCVVLSPEQMDDLVQQISSRYGISDFLVESAANIPPVSMSLYVLNDALWKMMERKPWDEDKMLAMSTIPLCSWDKKKESTSNPKAVKRWEHGSNKMVFKSTPPTISIAGDGGDFCGFIEQSMITSRKFGLTETRQLIPNYQFMGIEVNVQLSEADAQIHPLPMQNLDYDFSVSAKEFHDHGVHLTIPGKHVTLDVEKRKPAKLMGETHILIAAAIDSEPQQFRELLADIWFWTLYRLLGAAE